MSSQLDQVSRAAMSLTPEERTQLAERIWESVTSEEQASIEQAWCKEVDRRIARADKRGTPGIPAEQVLSEIEADLRKGGPRIAQRLNRSDNNGSRGGGIIAKRGLKILLQSKIAANARRHSTYA